MVAKKEKALLNIYIKDLLAEYSISGLQRLMKKNSYKWVYDFVTELGKKGILKLEKKGTVYSCSLNLENPKAMLLLSGVEEEEALDSNIPDVNKILNIIKLNYFTLLVTGSYANNTFSKKSDLDLVVIVPDKQSVKSILNKLRHEGELMIPEVHPYVFTDEEFLQMLLHEKENYGKEIFRNHKIIYGANGYYRMVHEAIKNGFKG